MSPAGGLNAVLAIYGAVTLANWPSTLRMANEKHVKKVFKKYGAERYPVAKESFGTNQMFIRNVGMVKHAIPLKGNVTMYRGRLRLFKAECLYNL